MEVKLRKADDRLRTHKDWLISYHTFSFGEHHDPNWMSFKNLRVLNDDYIQSGQGFPFHPHRNMEIITFMLSGTLRHKDSLGNDIVINSGELQVMSAGTGIIHSEHSENSTNNASTHLLQIWLLPKEHNIKPRYEQRQILNGTTKNFLRPIASDTINDSNIMPINSEATIYYGTLESGIEKDFCFYKNKNLWVHVFQGKLLVNDYELFSGDSMGIIELNQDIKFKGNNSSASFLIFELP